MTDHIPATLNVQFYKELRGYEWVPDFLKSLRLKKEIAAAKGELKKTRRAPAPNSELRIKLAAAYQTHHRTRIESLAKFIEGRRERLNPFQGLELWLDSTEVKRAAQVFSLEDVESACALLDEPPGALSSKRREKLTASAEKKLAELQEKLEAVSDPRYFTIRNGRVEFDMRAVFVTKWASQQGRCCKEIGPQGFPLNLSPPVEQGAFRPLQIHRAVNPSGLLPNPRRANYNLGT